MPDRLLTRFLRLPPARNQPSPEKESYRIPRRQGWTLVTEVVANVVAIPVAIPGAI